MPPPRSAESTHEQARREMLSDIILASFDTIGLPVSDHQLFEETHTIITTAGTTCSGSTEIREKLVRNYGEAQVKPRQGALLPLCKRSVAQMVAVMTDTNKATYAHVINIFTNPSFDNELRGIVESKDLFPLPFAPKEERWFCAITALVKKLHLVSHAIFHSTQFNTVLWVVGHAAMRVLNEGYRVKRDKELARYHNTTSTDELLGLQLAQQKAQPERARLRRNFAHFPPELRTVTIAHLAQNLATDWDADSNPDYSAHCVQSIIGMLCDAELVPNYTVDASGYINRQPYRLTGMEEVAALYEEEVDEVMTKAMRVEYSIDSTKRHTANPLQVPSIIGGKMNHIQHLNLIVKLQIPVSSGSYYPTDLYNAQDHIINIKQMLPGLKKLELTVVDHISHHKNLAVIPKSKAGETTKCAEIGRLVESLMGVDVKEKWLRYLTSSRVSDYEDRVEASNEKTMVDVDSFVGAMMSSEGVALEVKTVGSALGSVWDSIEERRLFGWWC